MCLCIVLHMQLNIISTSICIHVSASYWLEWQEKWCTNVWSSQRTPERKASAQQQSLRVRKLWKRWRATAWCENVPSHPDDLRRGVYGRWHNHLTWLIRMRCKPRLSHPGDIRWYGTLSGRHTALEISHPDTVSPLTKSSGQHNAIWTLNHPEELAPVRIASGLLMANVVCHPDDLRCYPKSSG